MKTAAGGGMLHAMALLSLLQRKDYLRSVWKNGLGFTDQIAIHPPGAELKRADFLWRVSSARIERDSPFSMFPEHDRVLVILEGNGVRVTHRFSPEEPGEVVDVLPLEPYDFPGDVPTECQLLSGPVVDLSVFLKKGLVESSVEVRELDAGEAPLRWSAQGHWNFVFAAEGRVRCRRVADSGDGSSRFYDLNPGEVLRAEFDDGSEGRDLEFSNDRNSSCKIVLIGLSL